LNEPLFCNDVGRDPQTPPREANERFTDRVESLLNIPAGSIKRLTLVQGSFEGVGGVGATRVEKRMVRGEERIVAEE